MKIVKQINYISPFEVYRKHKKLHSKRTFIITNTAIDIYYRIKYLIL